MCRWLTRLFSPSLSFTLQFHYFQRFFRAYNKAYCFSRSLYWYSLTRTRTRTKATSTPSHKNDAQGLARHTNSSLFGCLPRSGLVSVCGKAASFREARDERGRVSSPLSSRPSTRRMLTCTRVCVDGIARGREALASSSTTRARLRRLWYAMDVGTASSSPVSTTATAAAAAAATATATAVAPRRRAAATKAHRVGARRVVRYQRADKVDEEINDPPEQLRDRTQPPHALLLLDRP